jgi:UrcA family protein
MTASARVQYNPIMLTTSSGRALLNDRIAQVARDLCSDRGLFSNTDDDLNCVRGAVQGAKMQLDAEAQRIRVSSR